jgi:hypothetical protein
MTALPQFPNSTFILHFFAEQLIRLCSIARLRAVCMQNSIRESVCQLLIDKIAKFDLGACFSELESKIRSLIVFKSMQSYNFENIKSLEGYDTDPGRSTARPGGAHQRGARLLPPMRFNRTRRVRGGLYLEGPPVAKLRIAT